MATWFAIAAAGAKGRAATRISSRSRAGRRGFEIRVRTPIPGTIPSRGDVRPYQRFLRGAVLEPPLRRAGTKLVALGHGPANGVRDARMDRSCSVHDARRLWGFPQHPVAPTAFSPGKWTVRVLRFHSESAHSGHDPRWRRRDGNRVRDELPARSDYSTAAERNADNVLGVTPLLQRSVAGVRPPEPDRCEVVRLGGGSPATGGLRSIPDAERTSGLREPIHRNVQRRRNAIRRNNRPPNTVTRIAERRTRNAE